MPPCWAALYFLNLLSQTATNMHHCPLRPNGNTSSAAPTIVECPLVPPANRKCISGLFGKTGMQLRLIVFHLPPLYGLSQGYPGHYPVGGQHSLFPGGRFTLLLHRHSPHCFFLLTHYYSGRLNVPGHLTATCL